MDKKDFELRNIVENDAIELSNYIKSYCDEILLHFLLYLGYILCTNPSIHIFCAFFYVADLSDLSM